MLDRDQFPAILPVPDLVYCLSETTVIKKPKLIN